jgi:hypothetical protein
MTAEPRRRSSWAVWIAGAMMLLPVLYVLGLGPLTALWGYSYLPEDFYRRYIGPALWLSRNGPEWLSDALNWWVSLWLRF